MKKLLLLSLIITKSFSFAQGSLSVFDKGSVEKNITSLETVKEANEILISLSKSHINRLNKVFQSSTVATLYRCKTISLQAAIGGAGGVCTALEISDNGDVKVQQYIKAAIQIGPGIEVNQISDIEIYADYLSEISGQFDIFSNGAIALGAGVKYINADTKDNGDQPFFDGHSIKGLSWTWITAQAGLTIPKGEIIELELKEEFIENILNEIK